MNSFGKLLREYRNRSVDPETGKHLSQERLAALMGGILGTTYTSQAISDWERDRSQIHKDHRQVLCALIQTLHTCGGLGSPDEAERLLAAGNYRGLSHAEAETIFLLKGSDPAPAPHPSWKELFLQKLAQQEKPLTPVNIIKGVSIVLCWAATWLAISPNLDFSLSNPAHWLQYAILLTLSGLAIPAVLAWIIKLGSAGPTKLPIRFLNFIGAVLGYSLGLVNILTLALLSYNLYLYPWPTFLTLALSLWPVVLGITVANLIQTHIRPDGDTVQFRDIRFRWAILALPPVIGMGFYYFHSILTSRIFGPLIMILVSIGLVILFWSQTSEIS